MLLIVDDDPQFLVSALEILSTNNRVLLARTAEQAKSLVNKLGPGIQVVMVDLDFPGQDGFSLIHELRESFPRLPTIAISGVASGHVLDSAKLVGAVDALHKPIGPDWDASIL